jgi:ribose-phosphate pyrophosphokinase
MAIYVQGNRITPTIFPDGTSQVWKLPDGCFDEVEGCVVVKWNFESEAEVFQIMQLRALLRSRTDVELILDVPFLPYGRQDKEVSNDQCFALRVLDEQVLLGFDSVVTIDAHSDVSSAVSRPPSSAIKHAIKESNATVVCFPDAGAEVRYTSLTCSLTSFVLDKERDQATGNITGLRFVAKPESLKGKHILIIDDICDGGRTFIEAAKLIYQLEPDCSVHLYVSHGIFSKGKHLLYDAGIKSIFTKESI